MDRKYTVPLYQWLIILSIVFSGASTLSGQQDTLQSSYYAVASRKYGIQDGMPDRCVEYAFVDSPGRLKIIPCTYVQAGQEVNMYQFDGRRSYRCDVPVIRVPGQWSIVHCQTDHDGMLSGYLIEDASKDSIYTAGFSYHPDTDVWNVFNPPEVDGTTLRLRNVQVDHGITYAVGSIHNSYHLFRRENDTWHHMAAVSASAAVGPPRSAIPFHIDEHYFLIEEWDGSLLRIARDGGKMIRVGAGDVSQNKGGQSGYFIKWPDGRLLHGVKGIGTLYTVNFTNNTQERFVVPMDVSGSPSTRYYAYQDKRGNILCVAFDPGQAFRAWLLQEDGSVSLYSDVLSAISPDEDGLEFNDLISNAFTRSLFVVGNEFVIIEVASRGAVQSVQVGPTRGVVELSNGSLVFSRDIMFHGKEMKDIEGSLVTCFKHMQHDGDVFHNEHTYVYGTRGNGINIYDRNSGQCKSVFPDLRVQRLTCDQKGQIYVLANNKLYRADPGTQSIHSLVDAPIRSFVNEIFITRNNEIYLATGSGLWSIDQRSGKLIQEQIVTCGQKTEPVLSIYEDRIGRLWLGTHSSGLRLFDPKTRSCMSITVEEGLSSNIVASTIEDPEGDIWVGTYNGITIFDQSANILGYVYEENGLVDNECNRWAADVLQDGRLYFGSPRGFSLIRPGAVKKKIREMESLKIYPTTIDYDGRQHVIGDTVVADLLNTGIVIPAHNRSLRIGYALSSYASPESNRFAYKIDLPGNTWNWVGALYNLSLIDLPPGQYRLLIKGTDFRGRVSANVMSIPLVVRQLFYKTTWFYIVCALPFLLFAFLWIRRMRSERKRLEHEVDKRTLTIREQTEALRDLDLHKTRLYTNITHEFRTPLTVIRGLVDQVYEDDKAPELIRRNADSLLILVNQMLELRKLESGNLVLEPVHGNIVWFLQYIGESFRSLAETRSQRFHFLSELKQIEMDYDPDKLARVVGNLLSNAIKFTPAGGDIYLQAEGSRIKDGILEIKVIDTGIGIPEDQQEKIFDRFYQGDDSHIRRGEGTGIGLTLVSEFVKLMEGTVRVSSKPGNGTTFVISLPITHEATREEWTDSPVLQGSLISGIPRMEGAQITEESQPGIERHRILIVEDNPDVVHYIGNCLKDEYHLMVALDGQEGIEKALEQIPDIIISDVMMPEKDGFELCKTIKQDERTSHIPIILLTAKADSESRLQGLVRGADAYLAKPFDKQELLIHIANLIEQRTVLQKRYAAGTQLLPPSSDPGVQIEDAFIARVNQVLIANIENEDFGIDELCAAVYLGRTQLHSKLKALTGKSTGLYIRSVRIAESVRFLADPNLNVSEVAYAVGFSDPKYFARSFKQEFGLTPSAWREKAAETR